MGNKSSGHFLHITAYSKTPIYRGVWGKGNIRGKSGFCLFTLYIISPIWGKVDSRGISEFAVNRGFTV